MTRPGRLHLTAYAAAQVTLAIPALALLIISVVGTALLVVWAGLVLLAVSVPATRLIADLHRAMAASVLGEPRARAYRPMPAEGVLSRPLASMWTALTDPMTWRDLVWLLWASTFGFLLSLVMVLELLLVVTIPLWWFLLEPKMRMRCLVDRWLLTPGRADDLEQRVQQLTETRAELVDHSAAELRRLERDLHDGAQARLVAMSMNLGMADQALPHDPEAARRLIEEARASTSAAIRDLRSVVRGIHPPVLADRGVAGAVEALALDMAVPVDVRIDLRGRPPAPVESAVYFAVAECLANIGQHSGAERAWVRLAWSDGVLRAVVRDNGRGGAPTGARAVARANGSGTGIAGVARRLAAFDGTMTVSSPTGGPTVVTLEVPCALSSPKTTPSSGPA